MAVAQSSSQQLNAITEAQKSQDWAGLCVSCEKPEKLDVRLAFDEERSRLVEREESRARRERVANVPAGSEQEQYAHPQAEGPAGCQGERQQGQVPEAAHKSVEYVGRPEAAQDRARDESLSPIPGGGDDGAITEESGESGEESGEESESEGDSGRPSDVDVGADDSVSLRASSNGSPNSRGLAVLQREWVEGLRRLLEHTPARGDERPGGGEHHDPHLPAPCRFAFA